MAIERRVMDATDVETLVSLVGRAGAIQALVCSEIVKADDLKCFAKTLDIPVSSKVAKKDLARRIVRRVDRRIGRSIIELQALDRDEIVMYLDATGCDAEELRDLLEGAGLPVQSKMSRNDLLNFAAIEISSLGVFGRLATPANAATPDAQPVQRAAQLRSRL